MSRIQEILTDSEYCEAQGSICPNCRSRNIEGYDGPEISGNSATLSVICRECGASWYDIYTLTGYDGLDLDDVVEDEEEEEEESNIKVIGEI